jgi:lactate permease
MPFAHAKERHCFGHIALASVQRPDTIACSEFADRESSMSLLAVAFTQNLDPVGNRVVSTIVAALPVMTLLYLLVARRWLAPWAGAGGSIVAFACAWLVFGMPAGMTSLAFVRGVSFGLVPIGWTVFCAMLMYNLTVETGQFNIVRRSVAALSNDARIQAILIGFCFGAFMEGAAGAGSPVAICGAMLVGLGFPPIKAAVLCLIANTSPVCYGGLGVPILTLADRADLPDHVISVMCGHQLPFLSCLIPFYMVLLMVGFRKTLEVWPAVLVSGGSFALFQFFFATSHVYFPGLVLWNMTDLGGGVFSMIVTAVFLQFWKPRQEWHYANPDPSRPAHGVETPLTGGMIVKAWTPWALMCICLALSGLMRMEEGKRAKAKQPMPEIAGVPTRVDINVEGLHNEVLRAERLRKKLPAKDDLPERTDNSPEKAVIEFNWLTAPGTPVLLSVLMSILMLKPSMSTLRRVVRKTVVQMKIPIPTIAFMIGLSDITRYAGMDATLGVAFAETGVLYPFFAAILGWVGVFLTGTDAGSNALFGSLQRITADQVWTAHQHGAFSNLTQDQAQVLICTANSTGGVMGKMIDAQSICVATAGTNQVGKEADIFKAVVWHSILLASIVGLMTLLQAYVPPFTLMVPRVQ